MLDNHIKKSIIKDIALLKHVGVNPVIVHGGGPEITKEAQKAHIIPKFMKGLRYTCKNTMEVVKKVCKNINKEIVDSLQQEKCKAKNLTTGLIKTKIKSKKLGFVGVVTSIDHKKILKTIKQGFIPVISPIGFDGKNYNNINADTVATKIAESIEAEKLTILTNVDGIYHEGELISHLSIEDARKAIKKGIISRGMIPKVNACIHAIEKGVGKVHLINGTNEHALLLEIFTDKGIGTEIVKNGN